MKKPAEILVVDDNPMMGEQLRALLEVLGHQAVYLSNMAKAFRSLEETSFEVVFCDYWMPPHGGQSFFRQLGLLRPELTGRLVFLVSGVLGDDTQLFLKKAGVPQLTKPYKLGAVQQVLERVLSAAPAAAEGS